MITQKIKENMTQGVWRGKDAEHLKEEPFTVTPEDGTTPWVACERAIFVNDVLLGSLWMQTASGGYETPRTVEEISADHAAIITAVNGTYGKYIDPSKVEEMYNLMQSIAGRIEWEVDSRELDQSFANKLGNMAAEIENLLNSAKLSSNIVHTQ